MVSLRSCKGCGPRLLSEFYENTAYTDGFSTLCKDCLRDKRESKASKRDKSIEIIRLHKSKCFAEMFSEAVKRLRLSKGLTQKQFGEVIGRSRHTVYNYEKGIHVISLETLTDVAKHFNIQFNIHVG